MALTVGDLLEGKDRPITVLKTEKLSHALELMLRHDYSQLPVVDEHGKLVGIVTSDSIVRAVASLDSLPSKMSVTDAMIKARGFDRDADVAELLGALRDQYAAVVTDGDGLLAGIITNFDAAGYFRRRSEDMMLVEDIESSIKEHVLAAYQDAFGGTDQTRLSNAIALVADSKRQLRGPLSKAIRSYLDGSTVREIDRERLEQVLSDAVPEKKIPQFDDLSLSGYVDLLLHPTIWPSYAPVFDVERDSLKCLLDKVRETRNALAHFRGDISALQRQHLKFCSEWLDRHTPRRTQQPAPTPVLLRPDADRPAEDSLIVADDVVPGESRYAKLALWLQQTDQSEDSVTLTFNQVEELLGGALPESAWTHRNWWANDSVGHAQSRQWLEVGWRVASISITDELVTFRRIKERQADYIDFFSQVRDALHAVGSVPLNDASPWGAGWHTFVRLPATGDFIGWLLCSFGRQKKIRVELYIDTNDTKLNKLYFDHLMAERVSIEESFGETLAWERLEARRASRIATYRDGAITASSEDRAILARWAAKAIERLHGALVPRIDALAQIPVGAIHRDAHVE